MGNGMQTKLGSERVKKEILMGTMEWKRKQKQKLGNDEIARIKKYTAVEL